MHDPLRPRAPGEECLDWKNMMTKTILFSAIQRSFGALLLLACSTMSGCREGNPVSTKRADQEPSVPLVITTGTGLVRKGGGPGFCQRQC